MRFSLKLNSKDKVITKTEGSQKLNLYFASKITEVKNIIWAECRKLLEDSDSWRLGSFNADEDQPLGLQAAKAGAVFNGVTPTLVGWGQ